MLVAIVYIIVRLFLGSRLAISSTFRKFAPTRPPPSLSWSRRHHLLHDHQCASPIVDRQSFLERVMLVYRQHSAAIVANSQLNHQNTFVNTYVAFIIFVFEPNVQKKQTNAFCSFFRLQSIFMLLQDTPALRKLSRLLLTQNNILLTMKMVCFARLSKMTTQISAYLRF